MAGAGGDAAPLAPGDAVETQHLLRGRGGLLRDLERPVDVFANLGPTGSHR
jgi:hypothetical protein